MVIKPLNFYKITMVMKILLFILGYIPISKNLLIQYLGIPFSNDLSLKPINAFLEFRVQFFSFLNQ